MLRSTPPTRWRWASRYDRAGLPRVDAAGARSARLAHPSYRSLFTAFIVNQTGFWISHMGLQG
jgi:hypothetical protein